MVEFLVEKGADINCGDNEGWTPLHATASCGFISIAKLVIFLFYYSIYFKNAYLCILTSIKHNAY